MQDMQEGAYPKQKKKSDAGQFAAVEYRSVRNVLLDSKTKPGRLRGRQVLGYFLLL
jgi:hypothetical protein